MNRQDNQQTRASVFDLSYSQLEARMQGLGQPSFRARQVWQWIWQKGCPDFARMTNLSKELRHRLAQELDLRLPALSGLASSRDGTKKGLLSLYDGQEVEWVLIPDKDHFTLCLSTQVGCSLGCTFCSTGRMGFVRNLTSGEILAQVLIATQVLEEARSSWPLRNIVFMGMGEPLLNWSQVHKGLTILRDPMGLGFSHRRVTVSTVGVPGTLTAFAQTGLASLAVSLHAPNQALRRQIMPAASRLLPLSDLMDTLQAIPLKPRQRITVEYILLGGVNDGLNQARDLNRLLSRLKCKINLISFNPAPELPYTAPDPDAVAAFEHFLRSKGQTVTLRKSKGQDIQAACGQLRNSPGRSNAGSALEPNMERGMHAQT
ncbi:23S rRNA (adenine(2503)-C(2))-methyltransferase RlmN [Desulfovermiculus halophilus]|uniref:23S rRNA (adenine(2503)-C(2))-methyltransferase RlmN n=1 Tax=Desulfovermiculus halophilus TaxID=339722 RepID=UPI000486CE9A|nr:23S rRNA (adenine(2503)-C(2))-methyltransferase RlmN [Desulfovermiculus halophilus]